MTSTPAQDEYRPSNLSASAEAWYGNAAKMRIIGQITSSRRPQTVFDYGAGTGRGWAQVLSLHPELSLICYEPDPERAAVLRRDVPAARVIDAEISSISMAADVIVSFSVFEHVYDRRSYLANAKRWLKPSGRFYLNYDDGHFRNPSSRAEALRNFLSPALPALGFVHHYQARVERDEADRLVEAEGFEIVASRYENLQSFKNLAKTIPSHERGAFAALWLDVEDRLNNKFAVSGPSCLGDRMNLWSEMGSRTIELVHREAA